MTAADIVRDMTAAEMWDTIIATPTDRAPPPLPVVKPKPPPFPAALANHPAFTQRLNATLFAIGMAATNGHKRLDR